MILNKLKPNWRHLQGLQNKPFIHFNLQTFAIPYEIPYEFMRSFNDLPPDKYIPNNPVTRSRKYANIKINVTDNYEYVLKYNGNNIFRQEVDDNRGVKRQFELIDPYHINQAWILNFMTQISALSVLNNNYYKDDTRIREIDVHLHQVRQTTYPEISSHNSPEGIHRDGCDYIVSALVIMRNNITGGESIIYDKNKKTKYRAILDDQEGIYQEDTEQWHYVTPIQRIGDGLGFRDVLGIDIILKT